MFAWQKTAAINSTEPGSLKSERAPDGVGNRRATALVPFPFDAVAAKLPFRGSLGVRELLVSIEGNQNTCSVRIASRRMRSRSALLVFRGRVIGCIYGSKSLGQQLMGEEAFKRAMSDLAVPDKTMDVHVLDENIVLAAASLFHGSVLQPPTGLNAQELYHWYIEAHVTSCLPACIVVSDANHIPLSMTYLERGKIIGIYSFEDGWVASSYQSGLKYVSLTANVSISASILNADSEAAMHLTFSLTGLANPENYPKNDIGERSGDGHSIADMQTVEMQLADIQGVTQRTRLQLQLMRDTPVNNIPRVTKQLDRSAERANGYRNNHSHMIKP